MKLLNYLDAAACMPGLRVASQHDLFATMVNAIHGSTGRLHGTMGPEDVVLALEKREEVQSTAAEHGVAFPHARLSDLPRPIIALAVLASPILFGDEPVSIVCMVLVPVAERTLSLKIMAQFARVFTDESKRAAVLNADTPEALLALLAREEMRIDQPILARDIMYAPRSSVPADTLICDVAEMMSREHLFVVPVLDEDGRILGDITSAHLFRYGLPDFFTQLKSISFIAEFEPFDSYFKAERVVSARDLAEESRGIVPTNYTLMEIVFDLAIRHIPQLYVVDDEGRWIGTIDQGVVLHNVINH